VIAVYETKKCRAAIEFAEGTTTGSEQCCRQPQGTPSDLKKEPRVLNLVCMYTVHQIIDEVDMWKMVADSRVRKRREESV